MNRLKQQLIKHEGLRLRPYVDSEGILTIGVGRNLRDGISMEEAMYLLDNDITEHAAELGERFPVVALLDQERYEVLLNMAFNLGVPRLAKFKKMWAAIEAKDWDRAADEMLNSKWAKQVKGRATELAAIMRTG